MRRLPFVRLDPRGSRDGPGRDRRRVEPRHRRDPGPARADQLRPDGPAPQGLHPRRGPPDHEGRLERAAEVARGAARVRRLHVRLDPPPGVPAGDPVAAPAVRRPAPHDRRDRGQAPEDPRRRRSNRLARGRPPDRAPCRRRDARRRVDARPAPVVVGRRARRGSRPRPPRSRRHRDGRWLRRRPGRERRPRRHPAPRLARGPRPRPPRLPGSGHRGASRGHRRHRPEGCADEPPGDAPRDGPRRQRPDASRPSTRVAPEWAAFACSSSSRSSPTTRRRPPQCRRSAASSVRRRDPSPARARPSASACPRRLGRHADGQGRRRGRGHGGHGHCGQGRSERSHRRQGRSERGHNDRASGRDDG